MTLNEERVELPGDSSSDPEAAIPLRPDLSVVAPLPVLGTPDPARDRYRSLAGIARTTQILLAVMGLCGVMFELMAYFPRSQLALGLFLLFYILVGPPTLICWLTWFYRAHKNLKPLNSLRTQYLSPWTIFGYVVPFISLVRPYQVMAEVWKGSDPKGDVTDPTSWKRGAFPILVGVWWGITLINEFLLGGVLTVVLTPAQASPPIPSHLFAFIEYLTAMLTGVSMMVLTAVLVSAVTQRQERRYSKVIGEDEL